jgi:mRNA turnover protein 4
MPKSKRNRIYSLSQTRKKGREAKSRLLQEIRDCVDKYSHVFVYSVENMRNSKLKEVRTQWRSSRWFYGRNRVLATALGRSEAEEYREGLSSLAKLLRGNVGLFFTNQPRGDVISWFQSYSEQDHARAGFLATDDVVIQEGPLEKFPHSMEPHLRSLGLPTSLKKGLKCWQLHSIVQRVLAKVKDRVLVVIWYTCCVQKYPCPVFIHSPGQ